MVGNFQEWFMNKVERKSFVGNVFSLFFVQGTNYLSPLLALPFLANKLGVETFASYVFAQAVVMFLFVFVEFGFSLYLTKQISYTKSDRKKVNRLLIDGLFAKLLIFIFVTLVSAVLLIYFINEKDYFLYLACYLSVIGQAFFPLWLFQGMERMKYIAYLVSGSKVFCLLLLFLLVENVNDLLLAAVLQAVPFVIAAFFSILYIFSRMGFQLLPVKLNNSIRLINNSAGYFLSRFSVVIYSTMNLILLGLFSTAEVIASYSIAEKVVAAVKGGVQPIVDVLYPYMCREKNIQVYRKVFFFVYLMGVIGVVVTVYFSKDFVNILFGEDFALSYQYIKYMALVLLISLPSMLIAYPLLGAYGKGNVVNISSILGSLIHIVVLSTLYLSYGILDAELIIFSIFIVEFLVFAIRLYFVKTIVLD